MSGKKIYTNEQNVYFTFVILQYENADQNGQIILVDWTIP